MTKAMTEKLQTWLSQNFCNLLETTGSAVCRINFTTRESTKPKTIAVVFTRYHHDTDPVSYTIEGYGFVLVLPGYWMSIPKELVIPYIGSFIDEYLREEYGDEFNGIDTGVSDTGCNCTKPNVPPHQCPIDRPNPPAPKPPLQNNIHDVGNQLSGYFVPDQQ